MTALFTGPPKPPKIKVNPTPPPPGALILNEAPPAAEERIDPSNRAADQARADELQRARRKGTRNSSGIASSPLGTSGGANLVRPTLGR